MTLKVEQNPKKLWHGMTREDTARHEKAREGTGTGTGHEGTEYILLILIDSDYLRAIFE